jgi:hypothetical protein
MDESPASDVLIRRLLDHRGLDAPVLAGMSGPGLRAARGGSEPAIALLGRLAPALGMRLPDLLVITGLPVPEELAPWTTGQAARFPPSSTPRGACRRTPWNA